MKLKKEWGRLLTIILIVSLFATIFLPSAIATSNVKGYPSIPNNIKQKYYVVFSEGFRNGRTEMSVFDIDAGCKKSDMVIVWDGNLTLKDHSKFKNCDQYYINENGKWEKFIEDYPVMTDKALKIIDSNLNVADKYGNIVFKGNGIVTNTKGYPSIPNDIKQKYYVIFSEGFRNGRTEMSVFDIDAGCKKSDRVIVWDGNLTLKDHSKFKNCDQYYINKNGKWEKFIEDYPVMTDKALKIIDSNLNVIDKYGNIVFKGNGIVTPQITSLTNTAGGIKLSWNKVNGAYGYRIYQKTSKGWSRIKDTTATSYTDSAVTANQTKTYTIRCIDKNGNTVSNFNSKGWTKKYSPVAPTIGKLENTTSGIKLTWNKITGVYGYRVYVKTSSGWSRIKDTTATSLTDSAVTANQTKTYTIRCIDKSGKTISTYNTKGWSKKYTAATPKITKLTNTSKGVSVTWNKIAGVYGYRVYRKYAGGSWTKVKDTTATSLTDSGAKKGKKVTYTVRCIDKKGNTVSGYNATGWSITRK